MSFFDDIEKDINQDFTKDISNELYCPNSFEECETYEDFAKFIYNILNLDKFLNDKSVNDEILSSYLYDAKMYCHHVGHPYVIYSPKISYIPNVEVIKYNGILDIRIYYKDIDVKINFAILSYNDLVEQCKIDFSTLIFLKDVLIPSK